MIRPIETDDLDTAVALLGAAFPHRPPSFWRNGFARSSEVGCAPAGSPLGYFLMKDGEPRGLMLTFASSRLGEREPKRIVNLSSWFVDEGSRARAPMMLKALLDRFDATVTDLTATPGVARLLTAFGFKRWNQGSILAVWPQRFLMPRSPGRVIAWRDAPRGKLEPFDTKLLEDHDRLGCICAVLEQNNERRPLIFARHRVRGVPGAYAIYANDRATLLANRRAVIDFLAKQGLLALRIDADRADRPRDCIFAEHAVGRYYRGADLKRGIDYAYSELTLLQGL